MVKRSNSRSKGDIGKSKGGSRDKAGNKKTEISDGKTVAAIDGNPFPAKRRCAGATRSGDPCRYWATVESDFCYWCLQAGPARYPLPKVKQPHPALTAKREFHKRRCAGITLFGDPCRFFAVGTSDYCLWCKPTGKEKTASHR